MPALPLRLCGRAVVLNRFLGLFDPPEEAVRDARPPVAPVWEGGCPQPLLWAYSIPLKRRSGMPALPLRLCGRAVVLNRFLGFVPSTFFAQLQLVEFADGVPDDVRVGEGSPTDEDHVAVHVEHVAAFGDAYAGPLHH